MSPNPTQLHPIEVAMKRLSVGRTTVFELIARGELRSVKIARRRLISEAALTEYINKLDTAV